MPRIMRRTPETEEAVGYGYRDFLQEVIEKIASDTYEGFTRRSEGPISLGEKEMLGMALAGVGGVVKMSKAPQAARSLMSLFRKEGLKYDAFAEPIPGSPEFNYHQWTLYGEGPAKGATFGTETTGIEEVTEKIAELIRKFSKK